jgi:hypothetical protein
LLELDLERDAAGVFVYRSIPLLLLSVLILASTSIVGWIKAADLRPGGGSES